MTRPLFLLAGAALALSACAQPQPTRTVFISGPGVQSYAHGGGSVVVQRFHRGQRDRVVVIQQRDGRPMSAAHQAEAIRHGEAARRHAREAVRMARLYRPDPDELARITREARAAGEAGRRAGEIARRHGDVARLQGEQVRRHADEIRRNAQRLRQQCERGEIQCEIIITQ